MGPKRNMRMSAMQSSVKPLTKHLESAPPAGSRHSRFTEKDQNLIDQVTFDDKGVPILNGMDPTKVPIAGLSILERVERAKRMREERRKKETETGSSKTTVATDTLTA